MTLASTLKRILLAAVAIGILFTYLNHNEIDYLKREYFHKHFHKKNAGGLVAIQYIHKGASRVSYSIVLVAYT